jgi:hypothetical protein
MDFSPEYSSFMTTSSDENENVLMTSATFTPDKQVKVLSDDEEMMIFSDSSPVLKVANEFDLEEYKLPNVSIVS